MGISRLKRIVRQQVQTDALLGLDAVPKGKGKKGTPGATHREMGGFAPEAVASTLQVLDEQVRGCTKCVLCQQRTQTVFGEGDPNADLMFIGEGPGAEEDRQGRPFVGRSGELLTKMIVAMGFDRSEVYIANVVKCRPPDNRTPTPQEASECWGYLRRQIELIQPRAIVTLGAPATKLLLDTKIGIMKLRGTWHEFTGVDPAIPVMPTFHPAYVLRAYTAENRGKVWSDLQQARDKVKYV